MVTYVFTLPRAPSASFRWELAPRINSFISKNLLSCFLWCRWWSLSVRKYLSSSSSLKGIVTGYRILGWQCLSLHTLCPRRFWWGTRHRLYCSLVGSVLGRIPLHLWFSAVWSHLCRQVVFFVFLLLGVCWASWICQFLFFTKSGEFLLLSPSPLVSGPFSLIERHVLDLLVFSHWSCRLCSFDFQDFLSVLQTADFLLLHIPVHWLSLQPHSICC